MTEVIIILSLCVQSKKIGSDFIEKNCWFFLQMWQKMQIWYEKQM